MKKIRILIVAVCAVFILCSCAGGRMALNAKDASYPVSATQYLHDNNGILTSTYEVLYHFQKAIAGGASCGRSSFLAL